MFAFSNMPYLSNIEHPTAERNNEARRPWLKFAPEEFHNLHGHYKTELSARPEFLRLMRWFGGM